MFLGKKFNFFFCVMVGWQDLDRSKQNISQLSKQNYFRSATQEKLDCVTYIAALAIARKSDSF